jgi:phage replication-related protein YjqB (UPF0714/DUF867 family)
MPRSYEEVLRNGYQLNRDFYIRTENLENVRHCLLVAPHAGLIEPKTQEILSAVAALGEWAYYIFEGKLANQNYRELHITSTNFDEPTLMNLLPLTNLVLSFHGTNRRRALVYVGGLHTEGREALIASLNVEFSQMGLAAIDATTGSYAEEIAGRNPRNITNRGLFRRGMQLEFSGITRERLFKSDPSGKNLQILARCIHGVLLKLIQRQ